MSEEFFDIDFPNYTPVEIKLKNDDDFLKVRETLSRIGVASKKEKVLYQSCISYINRVGISSHTLKSSLRSMESQAT